MTGCHEKCGDTAKVVNNALIVPLMSGDLPKIWRGDMSKVSSALFEIKEQGGKFSVVMRDTGGATEEISVFGEKDKAVSLMRSITAAMMNPEITGHNEHYHAVLHKKGGGWFKKLLWTAVILFSLFVLTVVLFGSPPAGVPRNGMPPVMKQTKAPPPVRTGVPVPADELFGN